MSQAVPASECQIVCSNKGGPKLIHRGYIYTIHKQLPKSVRWRCTRRNILCKGSMTTNSVTDMTTARLLMPHCHVPDRRATARSLSTPRQSEDECSESGLSEQSTAINLLHNLGTAVNIKSEANSPADDGSDSEAYLPFAPPLEEQDKNWKTNPKLVQLLEDEPDLLPTPAPIKVSKRILQKKQLKKVPPEDEYFSQLKGGRDTKMKIVRVSRTEAEEAPFVTRKTAPAMPAFEKLGDVDEEVCLRWNSHHNNIQQAFPFLLAREQYVDVTLCSEGQSIRCHKLVLSACSTYFDDVISGMSPWQHPVIYLKGIPFWVLKALIDFMYVGEVGIEQSKVQQILDAGEELKIKGLTKVTAPQPNFPFSYVQVPNTANSTVDRSASGAPPKLSAAAKSASILKFALHQAKNQPAQRTDATAPPHLVSLLKVKEERKPLDEVSKPHKPTQNKRPPKRALSETSSSVSPLPEHLLFMRKGTRSRPLVKTPKIYQREVSPKAKQDRIDPAAKDSSTSKEQLDRTPSLSDETLMHTSTEAQASSQNPPLNSAFIETPASVNEDECLGLMHIKEEPIDISETDVSYGNFLSEENVLRFDEDEPGESDEEELNVDDDGGQDEQEFMEVITPTMEQVANESDKLDLFEIDSSVQSSTNCMDSFQLESEEQLLSDKSDELLTKYDEG